MNYIREINAFYQWQETNQLSSSGANLWHTLMHVNNRAGWRKKFTVPVSVLCSKANLSNSTFKRARRELRDKGYIRYESQAGNRSAIYEIISLVESNPEQNDPGDGEGVQDDAADLQSKTRERVKEKDNLDHNPDPLYKQNETKQKASTTAAEVIRFFKENFGDVKPYIKNELINWIDRLNASLVLAALERTLERGKTSWSYARAILADWLRKGFKTLEEIEGELVEFAKGNKRKRKSWARFLKTEEVIPDWFNELELNKEKQTVEAEDEALGRKEFEKLLARHASS